LKIRRSGSLKIPMLSTIT